MVTIMLLQSISHHWNQTVTFSPNSTDELVFEEAKQSEDNDNKKLCVPASEDTGACSTLSFSVMAFSCLLMDITTNTRQTPSRSEISKHYISRTKVLWIPRLLSYSEHRFFSILILFYKILHGLVDIKITLTLLKTSTHGHSHDLLFHLLEQTLPNNQVMEFAMWPTNWFICTITCVYMLFFECYTVQTINITKYLLCSIAVHSGDGLAFLQWLNYVLMTNQYLLGSMLNDHNIALLNKSNMHV